MVYVLPPITVATPTPPSSKILHVLFRGVNNRRLIIYIFYAIKVSLNRLALAPIRFQGNQLYLTCFIQARGR